MANIFRTISTKFDQSRPAFVDDVTKTFGVFLDSQFQLLFTYKTLTVSFARYCSDIIQVSWKTFLPKRDYVTFGSLLSQFRLSVCRLSVTLVHPTQGVEPFGKIYSSLCTLTTLAIL